MKVLSTLAFLLSLVGLTLKACPTCVGKVSAETPPFFADECYCSSSNKQQPDPDINSMNSAVMLEQLISEQGEHDE